MNLILLRRLVILTIYLYIIILHSSFAQETIRSLVAKYPPSLEVPDTTRLIGVPVDSISYFHLFMVTPVEGNCYKLTLYKDNTYKYQLYGYRDCGKRTTLVEEFCGVYDIHSDTLMLYEDMSVKNPDTLAELDSLASLLPSKPLLYTCVPVYRRIVLPHPFHDSSSIPDNVNPFYFSKDKRQITEILPDIYNLTPETWEIGDIFYIKSIISEKCNNAIQTYRPRL